MTTQKTFHVGVIIDSLAGGGAEKVMLTLATEMVAQGHQVTFFCLKNKTEYQVPASINVVFPLSDYRGRIRGWSNRATLAALLQRSVDAQANLRGQFDLVLVNLYESYRLASACHFVNCFYVIHNAYTQELQREKRMGPLKSLYMRKILKTLTGKRLIAVSQGVADELASARLFSAQSIQCIYNPFDITQIRQLAQHSPEELPSQPFILHVGRAAKAKRHDVLFKALQTVRDDVRLVCLSSNVKKLSKLAAKYGVEDRIVLPGFTDNPYAWMRRASALVLSSDFEGLPTVLIEAIICGTPVVSTDCPHGPREILQDQLAKFLVPVRQPEKLAEKINEALHTGFDLEKHPILPAVDVKRITQQYLSLIA
ncbi:glycosyltransferase [Alteromonas oceanisediminis]|uniref:glycosyltransferase n=1 Tax=Alteromonas oceanisediminis TaxID=2836180 RepID=UPI001BD9BEAD|nr:glycosyltransferase [Alteromonas oceanisediminis]MBT0588215.1 glycosyltransferase [Alteromonas oceanisediminis]